MLLHSYIVVASTRYCIHSTSITSRDRQVSELLLVLFALEILLRKQPFPRPALQNEIKKMS